MFLEPWVKKPLVFIAFEQLWSGGNGLPSVTFGAMIMPLAGWLYGIGIWNWDWGIGIMGLGLLRCLPTKVAETISFTVFLEPWVKKPLVFIAFEQLWSGGYAQTIGFTVFFALPPDHCC